MGELANPTQSAMSNSQLLITHGCLVSFVKFDCFPPLLNSLSWVLVPTPGLQKKKHQLLCNSAGLQDPTSKPNTCWRGEDHPACNLVGVLIGGGNSAVYSPAEPSPGPV